MDGEDTIMGDPELDELIFGLRHSPEPAPEPQLEMETVDSEIVLHPEVAGFLADMEFENMLYGGTVDSVDPTLSAKSDKPSIGAGRPKLVAKYPQILTLVDQLLTQHGFAAHQRRREETRYSSGVTLSDIRSYLFAKIPELREDKVKLSLSTIHRWFVPPARNRTSARKYRNYIDAKLSPQNRADLNLDPHPDGHYAAAQVNYVMEMASLHSDVTVRLSADAKNKLTMGQPGVDRRTRNRKLYKRNDAPNNPDQTFPKEEKEKLTPTGYMLLEEEPRSRSVSPCRRRSHVRSGRRHRSLSPKPPIEAPELNFVTDKEGRKHVEWPRTGPLCVHLKADKFQKSTSEFHLQNLMDSLLMEVRLGKKVVVILFDGGPDWNAKHQINILNYGRLWRDLDLDCLILVTYAPGDSRFNAIEHAWAPLNSWMVGCLVPDSIEVETQSGTKKVRLGEEGGSHDEQIYEESIDIMSKYWEGRKFDGFPVEARRVPTNSDWKKYNDHEESRELLQASRNRDQHLKHRKCSIVQFQPN